MSMRHVLLSKKGLVTLGIVVLVLGILVSLLVSGTFTRETEKSNDTSTSVPAPSSEQPSEAPQVPQIPGYFLGKRACDVFTQEIANEVVGQEAVRNEIQMTQRDKASITACEYTKDTKVAKVQVFRYTNEMDAQQLFSPIIGQFPVAKQHKEFGVTAEFKENGAVNQSQSGVLVDKVVEKLQ